MKASELTYQTTHNSISSVTTSSYNTLYSGKISAKKITGAWYYLFTKDNKTVYLPVTAFTGESSNTSQLGTVSDDLTEAINAHGSYTGKFVYNKRNVSSLHKRNKAACKLYDWYLYNMTASVGTKGEKSMYTKCTYKSNVRFRYATKVYVAENGTRVQHNTPPLNVNVGSYKAPESASDYVKMLWRHTTYKANAYPQFTVSVTKSPAHYNSNLGKYEYTGYIDSYQITGKGDSKNGLKFKDYVSLFTSGKKVADAAIAFVKPDVAIAKAIYNAVSSTWSLTQTSSSLTASSEYKSGTISLNPYDKNTKKIYRIYKTKIKSPIKLKNKGDFIETVYTLWKWKDGQSFDIDLQIK